MKKIVNYIINFSQSIYDFGKKYRYRIIIVGLFLVLGLFWGTDFVYAAEPVDRTGAQFIIETYLTFSIVIKFLSWLWIILANIAGWLLTNSSVTGDGLGLTDVLFGYHKFFQSLAWILMVALILKSIISDAILNYKPEGIVDTVKSGFIASIGIYFSWGVLGLLISFSNIIFLAVSDLGNTIIQTNPAALAKIKVAIPQSANITYAEDNQSKIKNQKQITDNNKNILDSICKLYSISQNNVSNSESKELSLDKLLPSADNLKGPLLYFGYGIFRFNSVTVDSPFDPKSEAQIKDLCGNLAKADFIPSDKDLDLILGNSTDRTIKDRLLSLMIVFFNIVFFSFALIVMIVANFLRMLFIWMILAFAPLIVLARVFRKGFGETADKLLGDIGAKTITSVVGLIFQPAVSIFGLCIAMFFVNGMYSSFTRFQSDDEKGVASTNPFGITETAKGSIIGFDQGGSVSINGNFFNDAVGDIGGGIGYIMMSIVTLYILFMIIKISNSFNETTGRFTEFLMKKGSNIIFDAKLPIFGGASLGAITGAGGTSTDSLKKNFLKPYTNNRDKNSQVDEDLVRGTLRSYSGIKSKDISATQREEAKGAFGKREASKDITGEKDKKQVVDRNSNDLDDIRKKTYKGFAAIKKSIDTEFAGRDFKMSDAQNVQEDIISWIQNGGLYFMKHAYKLDLKPEDLEDTKKLFSGKNKIGAFVENMLTNKKDKPSDSEGFLDKLKDDKTTMFPYNGVYKGPTLAPGTDKPASGVSFKVPEKK